jgi:hypothetical protein
MTLKYDNFHYLTFFTAEDAEFHRENKEILWVFLCGSLRPLR